MYIYTFLGDVMLIKSKIFSGDLNKISVSDLVEVDYETYEQTKKITWNNFEDHLWYCDITDPIDYMFFLII